MANSKVIISYRVSNLEQLHEAVESALENARMASGRPDLHPSEVTVNSPELTFIELALESKTLSDSSEVFELEVA